MINKKVMALLLSASMAFTASVPVLADYYTSYTGSYNVNFELEEGGKNYGIVYYVDGTHKKEEVDVKVSENSVTNTDTVYHLPQSPNVYGSYSWNIYTPVIKNDKDPVHVNKYWRTNNYRWIDAEAVSDNFFDNASYGDYVYLNPTNEANINKNYVLGARSAGYDLNFCLNVEWLAEAAYFEFGDLEPIKHVFDDGYEVGYYDYIVVDNGDGKYSYKQLDIDLDALDFKDDTEPSTDASTGYKVKAPTIGNFTSVYPQYEFEKWIDAGTIFTNTADAIDGDLPEISAGEEKQLPALEGYGRRTGDYIAVFKEVGKTNDKIVEKTVSANAGNHTIALKMNEAPAYTGGKLRATDFISSFKIDGKEYPAKDIKIKVEGDKKVGSKVKVTIKKIKGADKQTNKDVKGTVLGEVTIRPIDVSEVTTWNKTFTKEGQIVVKTNKNGDVKSVAAVVSKKGVNSGDNKAKKLKVKKGTYTYDSAKKTITFNDGAICKGTVSLNAAK